MDEPPLAFEQWRTWCFTSAKRDVDQNPFLVTPDRALSHADIARHLCTLFERSAEMVGAFSREQLAAGTWFVFGISSGYFGEIVLDAALEPELQARVYRGIPSMYLGLYEHLCAEKGLDEEGCTADDLDIAVFMIWDMDSAEQGIRAKEHYPHLFEIGFETLRRIVMECRRGPCIQSGLHGLGGLTRRHRARATAIIQEFIDARGTEVSPGVLDYAHLALDGAV